MSEALLHVYDSPFFLSLSLMLSNTHSYNQSLFCHHRNFSTSHRCTCPLLHLLGVIKGSSEELNSAPGIPMSLLPRHILRQASLSPPTTPPTPVTAHQLPLPVCPVSCVSRAFPDFVSSEGAACFSRWGKQKTGRIPTFLQARLFWALV